jgi:hypothetical protein
MVALAFKFCPLLYIQPQVELSSTLMFIIFPERFVYMY